MHARACVCVCACICVWQVLSIASAHTSILCAKVAFEWMQLHLMPTKMNSNVCVLDSVGITQTCPFHMQHGTHTSSLSDLSMYCLPFVSKDVWHLNYEGTHILCAHCHAWSSPCGCVCGIGVFVGVSLMCRLGLKWC